MTSRAEAAVSRQPSNAAMAAAAFHPGAACREVGPAPLSSSSLFPANQLSDCAKLSTGRRPRMCFNGAVEIDNALADRGEGGASAAAAAGLGGNSGLTQRMIDFLDQQPCPAVGHAEQSRARRDRSSRADRLQKRDLARPDAVSACEIDTNGKTWTGHGALAPGKQGGESRASPPNRQVTCSQFTADG